MRHPFWLLNSILLLICFATMGFIAFSQLEIPAKEPIEPEPYTQKIKTATAAINVSKIYESDLFGTYQKELIVTEQAATLPSFPTPPAPVPVIVPQEPKPQFAEPLNIALRGIIFLVNDDNKNRAIIADNKTTQETAYKVGDQIEDAQLVRIFSNKVLLIRANGQQEVLYLREKDAKNDPTYSILGGWQDVIVAMGSNTYNVNVPEFTHRVPTLAQFIDMLDLTTVYKAGKSIGCRIGELAPNSLGAALGLQKGDIIIKINDTLATDTASRFEIFKEITSLALDATIKATIIRNGSEILLDYVLSETMPSQKKIGVPPPNPEKIMQDQIKHLEEKKSFAPTLKEIIERERKNMLEKGKRPTQNVLSNPTE